MQRAFLILIAIGALLWLAQRHKEAALAEATQAPGVAGTSAQTAAPAGAGNRPMKPPPLVISRGQPVTLTQYLTPGKWTVFDFYSDYCPPCRQLRPELEKLHAQRADVNVVVVDINRPGGHSIDFDSPVAQQYGVHSIPRLVVYDPKGAVFAQDTDDAQDGRRVVFQWIMSL